MAWRAVSSHCGVRFMVGSSSSVWSLITGSSCGVFLSAILVVVRAGWIVVEGGGGTAGGWDGDGAADRNGCECPGLDWTMGLRGSK
jgi:hypothetical protein